MLHLSPLLNYIFTSHHKYKKTLGREQKERKTRKAMERILSVNDSRGVYLNKRVGGRDKEGKDSEVGFDFKI